MTRNKLKGTLRRTAIGLAALSVTGLLFLVAGYLYLRADVPTINSLADYNPAQATKLYSDDGHLVAFLAHERRTVVPIESLPKHVVHAFLAAEDAGFYEHDGLDYFGILRAAIKNLRPGAHLQGASTITQQTVKTMVLGPERSYVRKMREAILARQLEQMLTKDGILHLYLNQVYFGSGAHGVEEAARVYFGKPARDLSPGEAAYLASALKNPSRYTIRANPAAAKERQKYVLQQMIEEGWLDEAAGREEMDAPVPLPARPNPFLRRAPHFVEHARRLLVEELGEETAYEGGLTVYLAMNARMQVAAQDALRKGLEDLARRHGWPGARVRIEVDKLARYREALHERLAEELDRLILHPGARRRQIWDLSRVTTETLVAEEAVLAAMRLRPLEMGQRVTALVREVDSVEDRAWIDLGTCEAVLSLAQLSWARPFSPTNHTAKPRDIADVLNKGDLIQVDVVSIPTRLAADKSAFTVTVDLVPEPKAEGALVSIDPHTRYVRAMVGGYVQRPGGLIRAVQSMRQPGSAFKPIVYATGLETGEITPAGICNDTQIVIRDPWTGKAWKPANYDRTYDGPITYRNALMRSKNTCSVKLVEKIGYEKVIATAKAMGITSELPENSTIALGSGDVTPVELANAYATIAAGGYRAEPIFVRKVVDRTGAILLEKRAEPEEVLRPAVAYVLSQMMRSVVDEGTATRALVLDRPLAGKTGTSNESRNVWFGGFSRELVAVVWAGFDDNKPLGRAYGSNTALPIWIRYMGRALDGVPQREFEPPEDVAFARVDPLTGRPSEEASAIEETFVAGTEPTEATAPLPSIFIEDDNELDGGIGP
jgi:penicillin-binding protein 1A